MRTNAILILSAFMLILMIPASSSNTNQNSTNETTIMTSTQLDVTQAPTGDTQKYSTFQTSSSTFPKVLSMTTNSKAPNTSSTSPTASTSNAGKPVWLILILLVIIVVMVIVGCVHHFYNQESDQGSSVPRLLLDVRESLRTCIRNLEDQVGVRLWLGDRRGVENAMEEADASQAEEGEEWKSDGRGGNSEVSNNENGEQKEEEDSDTSDDYSSMEGDNLRERALNRQNEEDKDGDETTSSSDESQTDAEGKSGGNKNEDSEELALVKSPQEDDEKADLCDVTAL